MENETIEFLTANGYEYNKTMDCYHLLFVHGEYRARNAVYASVVKEAPFDYIKNWHNRFITLAKLKHDFTKGF